MKLKAIGQHLNHYKYLLVTIIGVAIVGFIDDNSFVRRWEYEIQIRNLKAEIAKNLERHEADSLQLLQLKQSPKAIEKIARGRYFMKADDEDIFVISHVETE